MRQRVRDQPIWESPSRVRRWGRWYYVATGADADGRHWTAVNLRLTEPGPIESLPIDHFDGLHSFEDLPRDGRTVKDMWF